MTAAVSTEEANYDARYVPYLRAAEDRHFWFRARNAVIAAALRRIEPSLASGYRALEIGCGTGNTLRVVAETLRRGSTFGVDLFLDGLVHARNRVGPRVFQADIVRPPFGDRTKFDVIAMFDVLEHLDDDRAALSLVHGLLRDGGVMLLTVPASMRLWSAFDVASHHRRRYDAPALHSKLLDAGFDVEYLSPFMLTLYPIAWLKRRLAPRWRDDRGAFAAAIEDLRIVPILNPLLEWMLSVEAPAIARRRRLPFGTSLLAIGRRRR